MTDEWIIRVVCELLVHAFQQGERECTAEKPKGGKEREDRERRGGGGSAVYQNHTKFLLLRVALAPQIPPDWLNGGFQACPDQ